MNMWAGNKSTTEGTVPQWRQAIEKNRKRHYENQAEVRMTRRETSEIDTQRAMREKTESK